jgi:hypothetical protein
VMMMVMMLVIIMVVKEMVVVMQGCKLLSDIGQCPTKFGKCPSKSNFDRTLVRSQKKSCHIIHFFAVTKYDCKFTQFAFCNKIYEAF